MDNFIVYNNLLFFEAFTAASGTEIWRTDGTVDGTVLVKDILVGGNGGFDFPAVYNGLLYFRASNGSFGSGKGSELWRTDGTGAGTVLFANINNQNSGRDSSNPSFMTAWGGFLYFSCNDGIIGQELCVSNGTTAGPLLDIRPGSVHLSSSPEGFTVTPNHLFFNAFLGTTIEMWRISDANLINRVQAGLTLLPMDQVVLNDDLVYQSDGSIFRSDGITDGGVNVIPQNGSITNSRFFATSNGRVYFTGVYFLENSTGFELMRTDGTNAGTTIMADLVGGPGGSNPALLYDYNNTLYFVATVGGVQKWYSFVEESGELSFESATASIDEGAGQIDVNILRSNGTNGFATVTVSTSNDSATSGLDYTAVAQAASWQPGVSTTQVVSMPILEDMLSEGGEEFTVSLVKPPSAACGGSREARLVSCVR